MTITSRTALRGLNITLLAAVCGLANMTAAGAAIVDVTYTVSGSSGNYILDFEVGNNIPEAYNHRIYFFGVDLSSENVVGGPWSQWIGGAPWSNAFVGGSTTVYDNNWLTPGGSGNGISSGDNLSGFRVQITDIDVPLSVSWFAYAYGGSRYTGADAFHQGLNPGFEGVATAAVPGPVAGAGIPALMALGGFVWARRRRVAAA
jgi:hypothetical protein